MPDIHHGLALPLRYEPLSRLGQGGAGEVWAVRDRYTGRRYALKLLARDAGDGDNVAMSVGDCRHDW